MIRIADETVKRGFTDCNSCHETIDNAELKKTVRTIYFGDEHYTIAVSLCTHCLYDLLEALEEEFY